MAARNSGSKVENNRQATTAVPPMLSARFPRTTSSSTSSPSRTSQLARFPPPLLIPHAPFLLTCRKSTSATSKTTCSARVAIFASSTSRKFPWTSPSLIHRENYLFQCACKKCVAQISNPDESDPDSEEEEEEGSESDHEADSAPAPAMRVIHSLLQDDDMVYDDVDLEA